MYVHNLEHKQDGLMEKCVCEFWQKNDNLTQHQKKKIPSLPAVYLMQSDDWLENSETGHKHTASQKYESLFIRILDVSLMSMIKHNPELVSNVLQNEMCSVLRYAGVF